MTQVRVSILSITALLLAAPAAPAVAATLDPTTVAEAIEAAAKANLPDTVVRVDARSVKVFGDLEVPTDADLRVLGGGEWLGRVRLEVEVSSDGAVLGTVPTSVEIIGFVDVPVLRRSAGKGTRLVADHVSSLTRPLDSIPSGAVSTLSGLLGRTVKRDMRLGTMVREADLETRVDARRGRPITVRLSAGSLRIETKGVLAEDGGVGAWVGVVTAAGAELRGLLVAPGVVELDYGTGE